MPLTLNNAAITATNTAVAMPATWPSTADQSAPVIASGIVPGSQSRPAGKGPSSQSPSRTSSSVEPVTTTPTAKAARPTPITAGITSGRRTTRVITSSRMPNASAGSHRMSSSSRMRSSRERQNTWILAATPIPPLNSSHPVPARKPPTTG